MTEVARNFRICGNILSTENYSFFALRCANCRNNFGSWPKFVSHLEEHAQQHTGGGTIEWAAEGEWSNKDKFSDGEDQLKTENEWEEDDEIVCENDDTAALELEGKGRASHMHSDEEALEQYCDEETDSTEQQPPSEEPSSCNEQELDLYGKVDKHTEYFFNKCTFLESRIEHQEKFDRQVIMEENENDNGSNSMGGTKTEKDSAEIASSILYKNNLPFKRVRFNVSGNKIAIKLIELLRDNPILWDKARTDYNNPQERRKIIENWINLFRTSYNVEFTYNDITVNLQALRRYYNSLPDRKELHAAAQYVLEQCSFLPERRESHKIECEHCDNFFLTQNNYEAHLYTVHNIGESPYKLKCMNCAKFFATARQRDVHWKLVHIRKCDFPCSQCDRKFFRSHDLQMHMSVHTGETNFVCATCGKSFRRRLNLRNHEIRVHLRLRNFPCHLCDKAFYTKALLKDHINAHLNLRKYKCPSCEKAFHSCHSLSRHRQIHDKVKRYACKLCESRFHQFVGLNAHMKKRHCFVNAIDENETISSISVQADGDDNDDGRI